jgi:hypothetical protein
MRQRALFEELIALLQESQCELRALRELLVSRNIFSEEELTHRVEDIKRVQLFELQAQAKRRVFEKAFKKNRPTQ